MSRLAVFSVLPWGFELVREWAGEAGHEIVMLVTKPDPPNDPGLSTRVASQADRDTVVMITRRVADCTTALAELDVDLGLIFAYSHIPGAVATAPRHGMVNLHPALLPDYRGANANRALFEGEPRIGATLHWVVEEFDAGPVLAQSGCEVPAEIDPDTVRAAWRLTMLTVLREGVPKALTGATGTPQPAGTGKVAAPFRDDELDLDWALTARLLQARVTALLMGGRQPRACVGSEVQPIRSVRVLPGLSATVPGVVYATSRRAVVGVADGVIEVEIGRLPY
jgi:methionyl-tRNA formyltransferase